MPAVTHLLVALVLTVSVTGSLAACGSGGREAAPDRPPVVTPTAATPTTDTPSTTPGRPPSPTDSTVPPKLAFTATTVGGDSFEGATLAGKATVLWFWAPWCTVCARSASEVKDAASKAPDVTFVGVAGLSADSGAMGAFVRRHDVGDLTHLADTNGDLYTRFGVAQQHTFVLIKADGTVTSHPAYGKDIDVADLVRSTFG